MKLKVKQRKKHSHSLRITATTNNIAKKITNVVILAQLNAAEATLKEEWKNQKIFAVSGHFFLYYFKEVIKIY